MNLAMTITIDTLRKLLQVRGPEIKGYIPDSLFGQQFEPTWVNFQQVAAIGLLCRNKISGKKAIQRRIFLRRKRILVKKIVPWRVVIG